jgi:Cdc6-like AAA superfamily ATPase
VISLVNISRESEVDSSSKYYSHFYDRPAFVCRYLFSEKTYTLFEVNVAESIARGIKDAGLTTAFTDTDQQTNGAQLEDSATGNDVYARAIRTLDLSFLPEHFPCREVECAAIEAAVRKGIENGGGMRPVYICGLPGTGKTASVVSVVEKLRRSDMSKPFKFVTINCLKLKVPADAYSILWRTISGKHLGHAAALKRLLAYFDGLRASDTTANQQQSAPFVTVCLVDEIDFLLTSNQTVLYNILDWPSAARSNLVVLGLANTMDLPERFNKRITSRIGTIQDRMVFKPYSIAQIEEILQVRMGALKVFENSSLKLLTRKAATVAGDLRAALRICQRAIELHRCSLSAEELLSETVKPVPVLVVNKAANGKNFSLH